MHEYEEIKKRYELTPEDQQALIKLSAKLAFDEFDCQLEEYDYNDKYEWNDGAELMDITEDQLLEIIDDYLSRMDADEFTWHRVEQMRHAIEDVTGLVC